MINFKSFMWFLPKNIKNNLLYFTGSILMSAILFLILSVQLTPILELDQTWFGIFLVLALSNVIYNTTFYIKYSKRIGLLLLYGAGKIGVFFFIFLEMFFIAFMGIFINSFITGVSLMAAGIFLLLTLLNSLSPVIYFMNTDIYQIVRE